MPLKAIGCLLLFWAILSAQSTTFKAQQLRHARVAVAFTEKRAGLAELLATKNLSLDRVEVFLRAYKKDRVLEVWAKPLGRQAVFQRIKTYPFCAFSGELGPKRAQGDRQIPEGFYQVNHFNPNSNFYLSLGINYPNHSDSLLATARDPGDDIYIHGDCVTIGCIPLTDEGIKELYTLCVEACHAGQRSIPVHIFPSCMSGPDWTDLLATGPDPIRLAFWENLKIGHDYFNTHQQLPQIQVDKRGQYLFN